MKFQQSNAISYLIHTEGHDILGNASLPKEMRAFLNNAQSSLGGQEVTGVCERQFGSSAGVGLQAAPSHCIRRGPDEPGMRKSPL
ncbi:hypothetical protein EYF80_013029 [Liparis tanakae]|uniref:Uncharacterized protein n=1 Tax=Liparis tanakae TaxID=230148 RepID=A0A4Z2IFU5_9TELE|nr:hypothetical protein EYF80_013029 [Liparis tanakae]